MSINLVEHNSNDVQSYPKGIESSFKESSPFPASKVERRRGWLFWLLSLAVLGIAYGLGFLSATPHLDQRPTAVLGPATTSDSSRIFVTSEPVVRRTLQRSVEAVGTLFGFEELAISSKLEGRVVKIHYDLASIVKPGDVLLELDETDAKLAVEQASRSVQAELAKWGFTQIPTDNEDLTKLPTVISAKLRYELAKSRLERMVPLQASNSISADDLEQAKSDARVLESDYRNQLLMAGSAAATARLRNAELMIAQQRLNDCKLRVPTPTMTDNAADQIYAISERLVSEGSQLRQGTEVFRLVLGKTLKLRLAVPEAFSGKIATGQKVLLTTSSIDHETEGTVARISPAIDRATRTFIVEVEVPNHEGLLKPGSFAKAKILIDSDPNAITVSHAAVYSFAGIHKLFLLENQSAREVKVRLGDQSSEWVEIVEPKLSEGAMVITSGQRLLSEGALVSLREIEPQASEGNQDVLNDGSKAAQGAN